MSADLKPCPFCGRTAQTAIERDVARNEVHTYAALAEEFCRERDALKADAERYRWLRDHRLRGDPRELDEAIDAIRGKQFCRSR